MDWWLLFFAGVIGGVINSVAGGGSFITFPALMLVGISPIVANATNTFSVSAGYVSGAYGFRDDFMHQPARVAVILALSVVGGAIGAALLITINEQLFTRTIPWLLLFATLLFLFGSHLSRRLEKRRTARWILPIVLILVSAYGGFFNAGLGIVVLSYLILAGYQDINQMNGLKLVVSSGVSLSAMVVFVYQGMIAWLPGLAVLTGSVFGGYLAARISRQLAPIYIKTFVVVSSIIMTTYFFVDAYI